MENPQKANIKWTQKYVSEENKTKREINIWKK